MNFHSVTKTNIMKKSIFLLSVVLSGILVTTIYNCSEDPKETCTQDEICTAKFVDACCTDNECVYKYDGKEYTNVDDAAIAMGCESATLKSAGGGCDLKDVIAKLEALMARARHNAKLNN
jgi:hypothetical protein